METHHAETIREIVAKFEPDTPVRALLLGGSIAHGFAGAGADIDIAIILSMQEPALPRRWTR
jgi:hypothetical protein